ncbi:MAG: hypothetical protein WA306_09320 [Candidatus Acidiferrales bacterium]
MTKQEAQNREEMEAVKTLQSDIMEFLEERHKTCGQPADKEMIRFATLLMAANRENRAILGLLHKDELEVRLIEGREGSDIDDYQMRIPGAEAA